CLLAATKSEPHFVPLATVPLGDGARAANVLKAAMAAGFPGAMIGTLPRGVGSTLDHADLDPFWQAADETGAIIHIHPSFDAGDVRVNDFGLANGLGGVTDAAVAVARLICAGHVTKYKNARFLRRWAPQPCPSCSAASSAMRKLRPASATQARAWRTSIP